MARDNPATIALRRGSLGAAEFFHLLLEGGVQTLEILLLREDQKVDVFANSRRAVKHAGLPAHEQCPRAIRLDRRKDLSDRGRDQGYLPWLSIERRFSRFPESAEAG
jgi:hypothetical protein